MTRWVSLWLILQASCAARFLEDMSDNVRPIKREVTNTHLEKTTPSDNEIVAKTWNLLSKANEENGFNEVSKLANNDNGMNTIAAILDDTITKLTAKGTSVETTNEKPFLLNTRRMSAPRKLNLLLTSPYAGVNDYAGINSNIHKGLKSLTLNSPTSSWVSAGSKDSSKKYLQSNGVRSEEYNRTRDTYSSGQFGNKPTTNNILNMRDVREKLLDHLLDYIRSVVPDNPVKHDSKSMTITDKLKNYYDPHHFDDVDDWTGSGETEDVVRNENSTMNNHNNGNELGSSMNSGATEEMISKENSVISNHIDDEVHGSVSSEKIGEVNTKANAVNNKTVKKLKQTSKSSQVKDSMNETKTQQQSKEESKGVFKSIASKDSVKSLNKIVNTRPKAKLESNKVIDPENKMNISHTSSKLGSKEIQKSNETKDSVDKTNTFHRELNNGSENTSKLIKSINYKDKNNFINEEINKGDNVNDSVEGNEVQIINKGSEETLKLNAVQDSEDGMSSSTERINEITNPILESNEVKNFEEDSEGSETPKKYLGLNESKEFVENNKSVREKTNKGFKDVLKSKEDKEFLNEKKVSDNTINDTGIESDTIDGVKTKKNKTKNKPKQTSKENQEKASRRIGNTKHEEKKTNHRINEFKRRQKNQRKGCFEHKPSQTQNTPLKFLRNPKPKRHHQTKPVSRKTDTKSKLRDPKFSSYKKKNFPPLITLKDEKNHKTSSKKFVPVSENVRNDKGLSNEEIRYNNGAGSRRFSVLAKTDSDSAEYSDDDDDNYSQSSFIILSSYPPSYYDDSSNNDDENFENVYNEDCNGGKDCGNRISAAHYQTSSVSSESISDEVFDSEENSNEVPVNMPLRRRSDGGYSHVVEKNAGQEEETENNVFVKKENAKVNLHFNLRVT